MKKILIGILIGVVCGIIDVVPMIIQKLTIDANLSAFSMWVVIGFLLSITNLKINGVLKGLLISYVTIIPVAIIIGFKEPFSLIPILMMTGLLGSFAGGILDFLLKKEVK